MALASSLNSARPWKNLFVRRGVWKVFCVRCVSPVSHSAVKHGSSRDPARQLEDRESNFMEGPSVTTSFPSRLVALLREGGGGGVREGVGGVCEEQRSAARADLLRSLETTQTHLLSPEKAVSILCRQYENLRGDMEQRLAFISVLASDLAVNHISIQHAADQLTQLNQEGRSEVTLLRSESNLRQVLVPFYNDLFTRISRRGGGVKFLVNLRADILEQVKVEGDHSRSYLLSEMSGHLRDLLAQLFSPSLLEMEQLTWESPCDIMEKVSQYEAVHRLRHWKDLKHRVGRHRRCFVFTHSCLPRDPLVILHVALTSQPSNNIQVLLDRSSGGDIDLSRVTTAVFYSISATQRGLSGIDLGYFIIRRVVAELQREFPGQLATFVTLSPVPGFRRWLESRLRQSDPLVGGGGDEWGGELVGMFPEAGGLSEALQMALSKRDWVIYQDGKLANALKSPLLSLCSRYLVQEKRRSRALDPVAHFHLSGGASVWRLNWLADLSPLGLQNSCGIMCNYHYCLQQLNVNSDSYRVTGRVARSDSVQALLNRLD